MIKPFSLFCLLEMNYIMTEPARLAFAWQSEKNTRANNKHRWFSRFLIWASDGCSLTYRNRKVSETSIVCFVTANKRWQTTNKSIYQIPAQTMRQAPRYDFSFGVWICWRKERPTPQTFHPWATYKTSDIPCTLLWLQWKVLYTSVYSHVCLVSSRKINIYLHDQKNESPSSKLFMNCI